MENLNGAVRMKLEPAPGNELGVKVLDGRVDILEEEILPRPSGCDLENNETGRGKDHV